MVPMRDETVWRKNKKYILQYHELIDGGMEEDEALLKVFPKDSNRTRRRDTWVERGLWPLSEAKKKGFLTEELSDVESSTEPEPENLGSEHISEPSATVDGGEPIPESEPAIEPESLLETEAVVDVDSEAVLRGIPRDWLLLFRQAAREEAKGVMQAALVEGVVRGDQGSKELAPEPIRVDGTKVKGEKGFGAMRFEGSRFKLASTVDGTLYKLVKEEKRKRGVPLSRMLDTIIWHYFGKPQLSFEEAESESETPDSE